MMIFYSPLNNKEIKIADWRGQLGEGVQLYGEQVSPTKCWCDQSQFTIENKVCLWFNQFKVANSYLWRSECVMDYKYLVIMFHNRLNWAAQVQYRSTNLRKYNNICSTLKNPKLLKNYVLWICQYYNMVLSLAEGRCIYNSS